MRFTLALTFCFAGLAAGQAAPPAPSPAPSTAPAARPAARLADISWLSGHWLGEGLGGRSEEWWSASEPGGALLGTFRQVEDGRVSFYEILTINEEEGSLTLRLKHFNADLSGWEEKDKALVAPLTAIRPGEVAFGGIVYRRRGDDALEVSVTIRDAKGSRDLLFQFRRAAPLAVRP